ncbi:MAG: DUF21 domain-containing protein [Candidatus Moeniiplasma glomeromycotorum]|nr:DUF21 domain-containing protein [Candidatus Moeniiplasma glomeromycotorum]MCE8167084.1 DUF21 domain-containing protein [Candidatus Moeniiplasma glomeromycotorum]MCE8168904.1 DUF21 domain-containing protein [Candidatus Moeniiplasma glomeromycotorum]
MEKTGLIPLLAVVLPLVFFSFFLNYLSSSYSEANLFKLDLTQKKNKTVWKLIFILKNGHLLFTLICFIQVIVNTLISAVLIESPDFAAFQEKSGIGEKIFLLGVAFLIALFTELLARFLAIRKSSQRLIIKNSLLINITYSFLRPFSFLQIIIKPKKKLFLDSEADLLRFFNNLMAERVLEKKEARLVQSALRFDETTINHLIIPKKKIIFLHEGMTTEEVKTAYSQNFFTRYPVLDQKKEIIIGTLSVKRIFLTKENNWRSQIDKKVAYLFPSTKLDKAFEKSQNLRCKMMLVRTQRSSKTTHLLGIITLHDILNSLVGKIDNNLEKTFPFKPAS